MMKNEYIFRGRKFTKEEILVIEGIVSKHWNEGRTKISRVICRALSWYQPNGHLKEVACREALRRMQDKGLIILPPLPRSSFGKGTPRLLSSQEVSFKKPPYIIEREIKSQGTLYFKSPNTQKSQKLWRYLIQTYHYLGYKLTVGRSLRYFIYLDTELVALLGFGDGIYHHNLRDKWIGWDKTTQDKNRHLIVNNVRFLILPWVKVKNLASKVLSQSVRILPVDWGKRYNYRPILLETFVDIGRFIGTSYKAANWIYLGRTLGKGRCGMKYFVHGRPKDLYIYPLCKNYLKKLTGK